MRCREGDAGRPERAPQVLTNSWGCPTIEGCDAGSLRQAVDAFAAAGIFFVAAAGNTGPRCESVTDPPATFVETEPMRTPWVNEARIARDGIAIVCPRAEPVCLNEIDAFVKRYGGKTQDVTLARRFFGSSDTPIDYRIAIIPPR